MVGPKLRMDHNVGALLFSIAVLANLALIVVGVVVTLAIFFYRVRLAAIERREIALRHDAAFHHPDPINTPLFEQLFMTAATALVLVGLPVVLAATFHYLLPLLGHASSSSP
jgi:hypothetical protein